MSPHEEIEQLYWELNNALQKELAASYAASEAKSKLEDAIRQRCYDERIESEIAEIDRKKAVDEVMAIKVKIRELLSTESKLEGLPRGFSQRKREYPVYDASQAIEYCLAHAHQFLKLDTSALEKFIVAGGQVPGATIQVRYEATITDSKVLGS